MSVESLLERFKEFELVKQQILKRGGFEVCFDITVVKISTIDGEAYLGGLRRGERLSLSKIVGGSLDYFEFTYGDYIVLLPGLALQALASSGRIKPLGPKTTEWGPGSWAEVVGRWLEDHGYDGLCSEDDECGCVLGDLAPCGYFCECHPAYDHRKDTPGMWLMRRDRPRSKNK